MAFRSSLLLCGSGGRRTVNALFAPGVPPPSPPPPSPAAPTPDYKAILKYHEEREWSDEEVKSALEKNTLFTWGATNAMRDSAIRIVRNDGIYLYDQNGKRYLDWNSQAMCVNSGHTPDPSIIEAVTEQMKKQCYLYPGYFYSDIRVKLSKLLADIVPGDINSFVFPSSGAEANEAALRIARIYTGMVVMMVMMMVVVRLW